jgi:hypothetical protein
MFRMMTTEMCLLQGSTGSLMGKRKLIISVETEGGQVPDFSLSLSSSEKVCGCSARAKHMGQIQHAERLQQFSTVGPVVVQDTLLVCALCINPTQSQATEQPPTGCHLPSQTNRY